MLKSHAKRLQALVVASDMCVAACIFLALALRELEGIVAVGQTLAAPGILAGLAACLGWPLAMDQLGLYASQRRTSLYRVLGQMLVAACISTGMLAGALVAVRAPLSPGFPAACGLAQFVGLAGLRLGVLTGLRRFRLRGRNTRNVAILGTGPRAYRASAEISRHPEWGLRIVGYIDDCDTPVDPDLAVDDVRKLVEFPEFVRKQVIDEVLVACPRSMLAAITPVIAICAEVGIPVTLLPDLFGDVLPAVRPARFGEAPALCFAPAHHSRALLAIKRGIDIAGAGLLLLAAAPIIAAAALCIRRTSPGPVFFRQVRIGLNGRPFDMWKLRTMCIDAEAIQEEIFHLNEADGPVFKIRRDPRVTAVGAVLRRWSIDELPQLWNVLRGDMSLVGPRPPVPGEVNQYETAQRRRLSVRPGLTCIWQVTGRSTIRFEDWVKLDLQYIDTWSLGLDLKLLLRTLPAVVRGTGAS